MEYKWRNLTPLLRCVFATGDGKNLWAVGGGGTILHSTDGETWKAQTSNTTSFLVSVYGTGNGKNLWAVGEAGSILHSTDGETWKRQTIDMANELFSVYGTGDGKSVWAVGGGGTILHSTDGEIWKRQTINMNNDLLSVYGTGDGKNLWAVGGGGTILHSTDGETWKRQISNTTSDLLSVYGTGDGKNLWAVGGGATILHSTDGETWKRQASNTTNEVFFSVYGTGDGKSLWAVGGATILHSTDGETWKRQISNTTSDLFSVYGTGDGKNLWAVGGGGAILHSTDGETWPQTSNTSTYLLSVYRTGDGKDLWAVGGGGTILHSTDGETWKRQISNTTNGLSSVYGTGDGKSLWAVGIGGTILHSTDGETWKPQTSNTTTNLSSVYGTGDARSLWAVGEGGTILHSMDGETWKRQNSNMTNDLFSVYGTGDGKNLWAVGRAGTILNSTDGETWKRQASNTTNDLLSLYGTGDGRSLWAVGGGGTILHSTDGETWKQQTSTTDDVVYSVYGTGDGRSLWAVGGGGTILHGMVASRAPYLEGAEFLREVKGTFLNLKVACPDADNRPLGLKIIGWNAYKFKKNKEGSPIEVKGEVSCGVLKVPVDLDDLEMGAGNWAYFEIMLDSRGTSTRYHYQQKYDPWRWFIDHRKELFVLAAILSVFSTLSLFLIFRPLWNLRLYLALKQPLIEKLFRIPVAGPVLELIFTVCTLGLPWFVAHSRTLDAWVAEHRSTVERHWGDQTLPARAVVSERQRSIEATPYVALPLRIGDLNTGTLISQPTSDEIAKQFSEKRTVIQVIGPGGAGKTTFARQCGLWALMGGHPGGLRSYAAIPIWIDEDMAADKNPLTRVVNNRLAALFPDIRTDDLFLSALLKKQRLLVILDRLSERSVSTQEYFRNIYSSTRAEAIIITTRNAVPVEGVTPIRLFPQPLNENTLLYFMQALLQSQSAENLLDQPTVSLDNQIALAEKLSALYRKSVRADANILPLPVRLFVEEAKAIIAASGSLDFLPQTIPDVYSRYLERVNPDSPSIPNFMSHGEMLRAAKVLAKLALGDDFIPKEFHAEDATTELKKEGWADLQKVDPSQRLLDNGVLILKGELIRRRLKFVLDPIAEYLAAAAYLQDLRHDAAGLDSVRARARHATGFLTALDLLARTNDKTGLQT